MEISQKTNRVTDGNITSASCITKWQCFRHSETAQQHLHLRYCKLTWYKGLLTAVHTTVNETAANGTETSVSVSVWSTDSHVILKQVNYPS